MSNRLLRNASEYTKSVLTYEKLNEDNDYQLLLNKMDDSNPITLVDTRYWNRNVVLQAFDNQGNVTIPLNSSTGDIVFNLPESIKDDAVNKVYGLGNGNRLLYSDENIQDQYVGNTITVLSVEEREETFNGVPIVCDCLFISINDGIMLSNLNGDCYAKHPTNDSYLKVYLCASYINTQGVSDFRYYIALTDPVYSGVYSGTNFEFQIYEKIPIREIKESNVELNSDDELILNGDDIGETYFWVKGTLPRSNLINIINPPPYSDPISNYSPLSGINLGFGLGQSYVGIYFLKDGTQTEILNGINNVSSSIAKKGWIIKFDPCDNIRTQNNITTAKGLVTTDYQLKLSKGLKVCNDLELENLNIYNNNSIQIKNSLTFLSDSGIGVSYGNNSNKLLSITPVNSSGTILKMSYDNEDLFYLGASFNLDTDIEPGDWFKIKILDLLQNNEDIKTEIRAILEEESS